MNRSIAWAVLATIAAIGATTAPARAQETARSVWDGAYSAAQADRGGAVYGRECSMCHGDDLGGIDSAPSLSGGRFRSAWDGVTLGDLLDRIKTTMPASNPGKLSRAEAADVLSFLLRSNGFPSGAADLPSQSMEAKAIRFVATRPSLGTDSVTSSGSPNQERRVKPS